MFIERLNLEMPDDFDINQFFEIYDFVSQKLPKENEFVQAWKGVAYRFKTFADCDEECTRLFNQYGHTTEQLGLFEQEREMFHFFVNGLAVLESFGYAVHSLGSYLSPVNFPMQNDEQRRIVNLRNTKKRLMTMFPDEQLTKMIRNFVSRNNDYVKMRNILEHRAPGRIYKVSHDPTEWFILGIDTTSIRRSSLSNELNQLFTVLNGFVKNHI